MRVCPRRVLCVCVAAREARGEKSKEQQFTTRVYATGRQADMVCMLQEFDRQKWGDEVIASYSRLLRR